MPSKLLLLFVFVAYLTELSAEQTKYVGMAIERFNPCPNNILDVEHIIGLPASEENYWTGIYYLEPGRTYLEFRLTITLSVPANVTIIKPEPAGFVNNLGNSYFMSFWSLPEKVDNITFKVRGNKGEAFPQLEGMRWNGEDICPNPSKWEPIILGLVPSPDNSQNCGMRYKANALVLNGKDCKPGDWPWHAAIFRQQYANQEYICGGSLISSEVVVTAAHCLLEDGDKIPASRLIVRLGHTALLQSTGHSRDSSVLRYEMYGGTKFNNLEHDIALLFLNTVVEFSHFIQPICLWTTDDTRIDDYIGVEGVIVGFGKWGDARNQAISSVLKEGLMTVVSHDDCSKSDISFYPHYVRDTTYCAGSPEGTVPSNGDSGGGMYFSRLEVDSMSEVYHLRGLVSLTKAQPNQAQDTSSYVVFTDVAKYLNWISENTGILLS